MAADSTDRRERASAGIDLAGTDNRLVADARRGRSWRAAGLFVLAAGLVGAAAALGLAQRSASEPYVLLLLGVLAVTGVFSLFAWGVGLVQLGGQGDSAGGYNRMVTDSLKDGLCVTDAEGRIIQVNPAYARLIHATSMAGMRAVDRVFAADPDAADAMFRLAQAVRDEKAAEEEIRSSQALGRADGSPRWYRISVHPLQAEAGRRPDVVWQVADITHERGDQERNFQALARAVNFLDHAPAGFFSIDGQGRIVYMNATLAEWLGYDLAELSGGHSRLSDLVQGDGVALVQALRGAPGEVKTGILDTDLRKRNGQNLPVRIIHRVPVDVNGELGESRTLVLNRSPGEDASEALRAAEVRFTRFFNNTPVAIAALDRDGRIVRTNAPFMTLFPGFGAIGAVPGSTAAAGSRLVDAVADKDRAVLATAISAAAGGAGQVPVIDATLAGEPPRSARFYVSAVEQSDGDNEVSVVYALDTTEQKALEAQFAQGQKMQAIGQLAGGVAHDFNNVLTAIIGFSDLLLASHRQSDPAFQDIMNIKQNANRAAGLVRQLLAFSRRQTLRPTMLMLPDVLADLQVLLSRLLGEKVVLKVSHGRDLWPVMADLNQFEQVVVNLSVNARDAMPEGGTLEIRTRNVMPDDPLIDTLHGMKHTEYVMLEVQDTGTGMPPDVMEKIFEPFFSTKEVGKGTGLGLSTVYGIVKQTEGFIYPVSEVGHGTTFRIFLPRHIPAAETLEEVKKVAEPPASTDLTGTATILLVEDEEAVRAFAARALTSRGYTVHEATTGTEALEVMEETGGKIDLVVSDVVMPEMDGPSLLRELRKTRPDLKIIFVSGYAEDAFKKNLPENEKFNFLPKPFSLKQLATTVKETLAS